MREVYRGSLIAVRTDSGRVGSFPYCVKVGRFKSPHLIFQLLMFGHVHAGCLGENPYIRMMTDRYGGVCKMCERPFTIFKWRPGRGDGYKKTEVLYETISLVLITVDIVRLV